jgi:hypothetical protein
MKPVVPAVFQRDLSRHRRHIPIDHLYGAIGGDVGLRAQQWLPHPKADELAPFGGSRNSGVGREGGNWSFDSYCDVKNIAALTGSFA